MDNKEEPMSQRLTETERRILIEAERIKRKLSEMAHLSGIPFEEEEISNDEKVRRAIIGGRAKNLAGRDLSGLDLTGANLANSDLSGVDFTGSELIDADFSGAKLIDANLSDAFLIGADLRGADLSGAILTGAHLGFTDLRRAKMPRGWRQKTKGVPAKMPQHVG